MTEMPWLQVGACGCFPLVTSSDCWHCSCTGLLWAFSSCSLGRSSTPWNRGSGSTCSPCASGALGAGEWGFPMALCIGGSRAAELCQDSEGRAVGAPGRSLGGPCAARQSCCGVLQARGCNHSLGAQGLCHLHPRADPVLLFHSTPHLVFTQYRNKAAENLEEPLFLQPTGC